MIKVCKLKRHATVDIYIYSNHFETREVLTEPDRFSMSNMHKMPLLDFDMSDLIGKEIISARLEMKCLGEYYPYAVDVTTVSQRWNERYATYYARDKNKPWANGGWLSDVIMSAGNSVYFREEVSYAEKSQKVSINIPAEIICAMAADQSFGFALLDAKSCLYEVGAPDVNDGMCEKVFSSDAKLTVTYGESCACEPPQVKNLNALAIDASASEHGLAASLDWEIGGGACGCMFYNLYVSEEAKPVREMTLVEKFLTPNLNGGKRGTIIDGLSADSEYFFALETSNGIVSSEPAFAKIKTLGAERMPEFVRIPQKQKISSKAAFKNDAFSVGVADDVTKINPLYGSAYVFGGADPWENGLYRDGKVIMRCARGEKCAFQLVVTCETGKADYSIEVSGDFASSIKLFKTWCVKVNDNWYPEVAIPVEDGKFSVPYRENKIAKQKATAILVEVNICERAKTGTQAVEILIESENESVAVPVEIEIADVFVPRASEAFAMELNGYVYLPACAGYEANDARCPEVEREYYKLGFEHNGTVNILPYGHHGKVQDGYAPEVKMVDGKMRVTDWTRWDDHLEKYLNGSYIEDVAGRRVPVTHMYLPFHENWPMPINEYYKVKVETRDYPQCVNEHMKKCSNIYEDFLPGYREGIKSVLKDFFAHIEEKGWTSVQFQYFFNNKHFYKQIGIHDDFPYGDGLAKWLACNTTPNDGSATSWWLLDEPHFRSDWEAIEFFAGILREAQSESNSGTNVKFRADLSCFNHAWDFLDGKLDVNVVGDSIVRHREDLLRRRKRVFGEEYWPYGGWSGAGEDNSGIVLWILDLYLKSGRGFIPWYSFALDANYETPDSCAVLYPAKRFGKDTAYASMRLKAARKATELVKYLEVFRKAFGYSDRQLRHYVSAFLTFEGRTEFAHTADAGTAANDKNESAFEELKRDMLVKLSVIK